MMGTNGTVVPTSLFFTLQQLKNTLFACLKPSYVHDDIETLLSPSMIRLHPSFTHIFMRPHHLSLDSVFSGQDDVSPTCSDPSIPWCSVKHHRRHPPSSVRKPVDSGSGCLQGGDTCCWWYLPPWEPQTHVICTIFLSLMTSSAADLMSLT